MLKKIGIIVSISLVSLLIIKLSSCDPDPDPKPKLNPPVDTIAVDPVLKKIFFSLPSPADMASIIKDNGYTFDASRLNAAENSDKYTTEFDQAINLGVYGADLAYASIFDQRQVGRDQFAAVKKLAEQLKVESALSGGIIERIDANRENKDSVLFIVSDAYAELNDRLKNNNRFDVAAIIIIGGWVESLHLACQFASGDNRPELRQRVAEQKYVLKDILEYLGKFQDKKRIEAIQADMNALNTIFDKVNAIEGKTSHTQDASGVITIGSTSSVSMDDATLQEIATKTAELRKKYTKN